MRREVVETKSKSVATKRNMKLPGLTSRRMFNGMTLLRDILAGDLFFAVPALLSFPDLQGVYRENQK